MPVDVNSSRVPALTASSLVKRYRGGAVALRSLDLDVPAGSITALVGPNGAGKSTLLRTWMGFERPTSGHVAVLGRDPTADGRAVLRQVAFLAQTPALYAELTVQDHLDLAAHLRHDFDRSMARERLDALGVPPSARAGRLSGGEAAQLGLAIAIGLRAQVLLLDEPLAHLDPLARRGFLDALVLHRSETGATVVLSSHIVSDIERVCDRLVLLSTGQVRLDGPVDVLRAGDPSGRAGTPASLEDVVVEHLAAAQAAAAVERASRR